MFKQVTSTTPTRASKYIKAYKLYKQPPDVKLSPDKALSIFIDAKLIRYQYNLIRKPTRSISPDYKILQKAKQECYPESITVTEQKAEVFVQTLLNHTAKRIVIILEQVLLSLDK